MRNPDINAALEAGLAAQTADAQVDACLLVLGFAVQIASTLGWHGGSGLWVIAVAMGAAAAAHMVESSNGFFANLDDPFANRGCGAASRPIPLPTLLVRLRAVSASRW